MHGCYWRCWPVRRTVSDTPRRRVTPAALNRNFHSMDNAPFATGNKHTAQECRVRVPGKVQTIRPLPVGDLDQNYSATRRRLEWLLQSLLQAARDRN